MNATNTSEWLCNKLAELDVRFAFLLPSMNADPLCIALENHPKISVVVAGHEMAAGYMADGFARISQTSGLVVAGGGPGAHYALPAAINARLEGLPIMFVTGATDTDRTDTPEFQNTGPDGSRDLELFQAAVDYSAYCTNPQRLAQLWEQCRSYLTDNRAVHLMIPADVQASAAPSDTVMSVTQKADPGLSNSQREKLDKIRDLWQQAASPLLVLGSRLARSTDQELIDNLVSTCGAPVTMTIGALDILPDDHPANLGHFGHGGTEAANRAITNSSHDHVLFFGGGPGARDGVDWGEVCCRPQTTISRIDTGEMLSSGYFQTDIDVQVRSLEAALRYFSDPGFKHRSPLTQTLPKTPTAPSHPTLMEMYLCKIQDCLPVDSILFVDSGTHRRAAARAWRCYGNRNIHTSPEQAPMGWAISAAIGGKLAAPTDPVLCLTGDGCMRILGNEISTAARYGAAVIIVIANNAGYSSLAERSEDISTTKPLAHLDRVDWVAFSKVFKGDGVNVTGLDQIEDAVRLALTQAGPFVIDIHLPQDITGNAGIE